MDLTARILGCNTMQHQTCRLTCTKLATLDTNIMQKLLEITRPIASSPHYRRRVSRGRTPGTPPVTWTRRWGAWRDACYPSPAPAVSEAARRRPPEHRRKPARRRSSIRRQYFQLDRGADDGARHMSETMHVCLAFRTGVLGTTDTFWYFKIRGPGIGRMKKYRQRKIARFKSARTRSSPSGHEKRVTSWLKHRPKHTDSSPLGNVAPSIGMLKLRPKSSSRRAAGHCNVTTG